MGSVECAPSFASIMILPAAFPAPSSLQPKSKVAVSKPSRYFLRSGKRATAHARLGDINHEKSWWNNAGSSSAGFGFINQQNIGINCRQIKEEEACKPLYGLMSSFSSPEEDFSSLPSEELGAKIDLNLPRRRLQVSFTCDACGERSQRLINPHAYNRGTVFVQCAGCEVYHKLVDNLGLIEEYDFRGETDRKADGPGGSDAPEEAISNNGD